MATVTGLTAPRMLEIEANSVVDGDVVGDNLILTTHGGTQINAGSVRGPKGDQGAIGQDLSVLSAQPVLDIGLINQIRAGRQLTLQDFTNIGLNPPAGLWNLSDLTDASGNARSLTNKGAVPFAPGINGAANTAAQFVGSTSQALYIPDTGANDPFRIKTGSIGCWSRTAKRSLNQMMMSKGIGWRLWSTGGNLFNFDYSIDGSTLAPSVTGITDAPDDRWHFIVVTHDGGFVRLYIDGILEGSAVAAGLMFGFAGPVNIGGQDADASTVSGVPHFGRIDEAFVTADVLSDDQIRNLYCAKIGHTLSTTPVRVSLNVRRRRKGAALVSADFPTQPLRLHNFSAGSLGDEGSNGVALNNQGAVSVSGVDGSRGNAFHFNGSISLYSTDAGLPSGTTAKSYGCWFKTTALGIYALIGWGTYSAAISFMCLLNNPAGVINSSSGADGINGPFVADGVWHQAITVEDPAAADGIKRKLYVDGKLVGVSTVINTTTLSGSAGFRLGCLPTGTWALLGQLDGAFVCGYALTSDQIWALYAKGSQSLGISPKNSGDHIEAIRATDLLATFDTLDSQHQIDLAVA